MNDLSERLLLFAINVIKGINEQEKYNEKINNLVTESEELKKY